MYLGAGLALTGAALFYQSIPLLGYAGVFLVITHMFVVLYEEPTLRRTFDGDYEAYCRRVGGGGRNREPCLDSVAAEHAAAPDGGRAVSQFR
jgi:hypothetical protein